MIDKDDIQIIIDYITHYGDRQIDFQHYGNMIFIRDKLQQLLKEPFKIITASDLMKVLELFFEASDL